MCLQICVIYTLAYRFRGLGCAAYHRLYVPGIVMSSSYEIYIQRETSAESEVGKRASNLLHWISPDLLRRKWAALSWTYHHVSSHQVSHTFYFFNNFKSVYSLCSVILPGEVFGWYYSAFCRSVDPAEGRLFSCVSCSCGLWSWVWQDVLSVRTFVSGLRVTPQTYFF